MRNKNQPSPAPQIRKSNEPSTAGGRELRLKARPPARFSWLRTQRIVNQQQEPSGNTLLAQRYTLSGNSYLWRTAWANRNAGGNAARTRSRDGYATIRSQWD